MTTMNTRLTFRCGIAAAFLMACAILSGCGQHVDKISDINDNPSKYENQQVTLAGHVSQVYGVPLGLSSYAAYKLDDDSGSIWVITHDGAPEKGTELGIKGTVKSVAQALPAAVAPYLSQIVGEVVEEQERRTR